MPLFTAVYDLEAQKQFESALSSGKLEKAANIILNLRRAPSVQISPGPELTRRYEQNIARTKVMIECLSLVEWLDSGKHAQKIAQLEAQLKDLEYNYNTYKTVQ